MPFPTKSGIYGMYLAALGARGGQEELLEELASYPLTVYSFVKGESAAFLMDFQMVGSGYRDDKDHPWERLLIPKTIEGKASVGGGSKITYRYYLQDARFGVVHEIESSRGRKIADALQQPVFDLCLGRKNCVPTDIIYRGLFDTYSQAESAVFDIAKEKTLLEDFRVVEGENEGEVMVLSDVPLRFGEHKQYRERFVTLIRHET